MKALKKTPCKLLYICNRTLCVHYFKFVYRCLFSSLRVLFTDENKFTDISSIELLFSLITNKTFNLMFKFPN